jgi:hypothetical protein
MAIEWGFLILLAVGAAVADLRPAYIILVMTIGWILVVLVELLAWRARPAYVVTEARAPAPHADAPVVAAADDFAPPSTPPVTLPPVLDEPAPAPAYDFQFQPPAEEQTAVVPTPGKAPLAADDPYAPAPERELLALGNNRQVYSLEPLQARPKRKYRWFGAYLPREGETPDKGD